MGRRSLTPTNVPVPNNKDVEKEFEQAYSRYNEMDGDYYSINSDITDTRYPVYNQHLFWGYLLLVFFFLILWNSITSQEEPEDINMTL